MGYIAIEHNFKILSGIDAVDLDLTMEDGTVRWYSGYMHMTDIPDKFTKENAKIERNEKSVKSATKERITPIFILLYILNVVIRMANIAGIIVFHRISCQMTIKI